MTLHQLLLPAAAGPTFSALWMRVTFRAIPPENSVRVFRQRLMDSSKASLRQFNRQRPWGQPPVGAPRSLQCRPQQVAKKVLSCFWKRRSPAGSPRREQSLAAKPVALSTRPRPRWLVRRERKA